MFKKSLVAILFFTAYHNSFSQISNTMVSLNPFTLLEPDAGITPGFGFTFYKNFVFYTETGIIFYAPYNRQNGDIENIIGYKIKPALRYFVKPSKINEGFFVELQGLYKNVKYNRSDIVEVIDQNGNLAYNYIGGYNVIKKVSGVNIIAGGRIYFSEQKRFGFEVFGGVGLRNKKYNVNVDGLPQGLSFNKERLIRRQSIITNIQDSHASVPFGIKLIYRLQ